MNNGKLSEVFYTLSVSERNQFEKFIHSPFHNRHEKVIALFNYLHQSGPKDTAVLDKKTIFPVLFPGEKYNDLKLRHVSSYLQKLLEDFLVWKELESDTERRNIYLLESLRNRKIDKVFENKWK